MKNLSIISNGMNQIQTLNLPIPIIHPLTLKWRFSLKMFWILSSVSIVAFLIFYILQINFLTKETYLIQNYQKQLNQLSLENENLEINFSQLNSLGSIEKYLENQNFEKISKVKYIRVLGSTVVTK